MSRYGNLCRIWILGAVLAALPAASQGFENVAIRPAAPTVADDIVLEVTADVNALCGDALALGWFSPESPEIPLFVVTVSPGGGCPASVELFTFEFPLRRLAAGTHTVGLMTPQGGSLLPLFEPLVTFVVSADPGDHVTLHERFEIRAVWQDFAGGEGIGRPVPDPSEDSALLWFFAPDNWEILLKILDGCALNGHWWILGSGATNVPFTLEVRDLETGAVWAHINPSGQVAGTFLDTSFSNCT